MKISKFTLVIILIGIAFLIFRFGIQPPIPSSLLYFYLGIAIFAIFLFISVSNESLNDFYAPIKRTITDKKRRPLKLTIFFVLPILVALLTYLNISKETEEPLVLRSIHPAPPSQIHFRGKTLNLTGLENPLRSDKINYERYIEQGAKIYFQNCFFCHGDNFDGKGHFASALNPLPADFRDKGTIAQLQESYVFWRISKGGPGLPNEGTPWNSAMPAWEDILSEEETWKVIMFIYRAAGVSPRTWEEDRSDHNQESSTLSNDINISTNIGKNIYMAKCQYCHGVDGKGDGPAADFLSPRPRDLTKARYKLKSTPGGELPTDQDIFNIISNGIKGTSMPGWLSLTEKERWQLVKYIKSLAKRFKRAKGKGRPEPDPIVVGNPISLTDKSIENGKLLFNKLGCPECHGKNGKGNGPNALTLRDDWGHNIRPANLWKYWKFKGGASTKDIYKIITTGLAGTPMPSFIDSVSEVERWHLSNHVRSIGPKVKPKKSTLLKPHFVNTNLPETVDDPIWDEIETNEFPLFGQILVEPKLYTPSIEDIYVKSIFNNNEIAFLVEWDDISNSTPGDSSSEHNTFPDEVVIQFPNKVPVTAVSERPYFLMGDKLLGVNLWKWNTIDGFNELNSNGITTQRDHKVESLDINGTTAYLDGRYKALFRRKLITKDKTKDIQFETNKFIPFAFSLRDGYNGETETKMSVSSWFNLFLEKKETGQEIIYALIAGLSIVLAEFIVLLGVKDE